jgi:hypothetical protein
MSLFVPLMRFAKLLIFCTFMIFQCSLANIYFSIFLLFLTLLGIDCILILNELLFFHAATFHL